MPPPPTGPSVTFSPTSLSSSFILDGRQFNGIPKISLDESRPKLNKNLLPKEGEGHLAEQENMTLIPVLELCIAFLALVTPLGDSDRWGRGSSGPVLPITVCKPTTLFGRSWPFTCCFLSLRLSYLKKSIILSPRSLWAAYRLSAPGSCSSENLLHVPILSTKKNSKSTP